MLNKNFNILQYFAKNDVFIYIHAFYKYTYIFDLIRLDLNYERPLNQGYIRACVVLLILFLSV